MVIDKTVNIIMEASKQTIQQIKNMLRKVIAKFPAEAEPVMTDIHLLVNGYTGEIHTYNDDEEELGHCIVEEWAKHSDETFYESIVPILRRCIEDLRQGIEKMSIMQPFSIVLIGEDHETLQDLVIIDGEDTVMLDVTLLDGLEEDLDTFLKQLLED